MLVNCLPPSPVHKLPEGRGSALLTTASSALGTVLGTRQVFGKYLLHPHTFTLPNLTICLLKGERTFPLIFLPSFPNS